MSYEVIVIGGSFAGLSAALQLARARRRVLVLDSGQPRNRFAQFSHGLFGHDGQTPSALLEEARSQLLSYDTVSFTEGLVSDAAVTSRQTAGGRDQLTDYADNAEPKADGSGQKAERRRQDAGSRTDEEFAVTVAGGPVHTAARLILATGVRDELAPIPGMQERWGISVLHCFYCHGYEVAGRRLAVLATSDRALQTAMLLPDWSEHVTLFTNRALNLSPEQMDELGRRGVSVETKAVVGLLGDSPTLSALRLEDGRTIAVDAIFTNSRTRMASPLAEQLGCEFDDGPSGPFIRTGADKQTTVPGVYAAGDAARAGHNASWAVADGVTAGISAHQSLTLNKPACR